MKMVPYVDIKQPARHGHTESIHPWRREVLLLPSFFPEKKTRLRELRPEVTEPRRDWWGVERRGLC